MLTLATGNTISGVGSVASKLTCTIMGDEVTASADAFKVLDQRQLPSSAGTLYTVPAATSALVKSITIVNTDSSTRTASLTVNGTAGANQILPPISILAGGYALYDGSGWHLYNDQGQLLSVGATGATGATGAAGANTIIVQDEGTPLATDATTLNFVGAGVVASGTGAAKTITIAGGSWSVATDAIWDAKGDLAVGTGADTAAKLTAGTNGYVLTADSAESTGLKWAAGGGGGVTTYSDASTHTVNNTATETNIFTAVSVPGGSIGANGVLRGTIICNLNHGITEQLTLRVYHGTTVIASKVCNWGANAASKDGRISFHVQNLNAQNSQYCEIDVYAQDGAASGSASYIRVGVGTAAVDTSVTQNVKVTAQWSLASASLTFTAYAGKIEIVP